MSRVERIKASARSIGNIGMGIPAPKQIEDNKNNARTRKGWRTRRKNLEKKASNIIEPPEKTHIPSLKSVARTIAYERTPKNFIRGILQRRTLDKVRGKDYVATNAAGS